MKTYIFTMILVSAFGLAAHAQSLGGNGGGIFLVKTDLKSWALDNAINAEVEWKLNDRRSLSLGFSSGSQEYTQQYQASQYAGWTNSFLGDNTYTVPDKGIVNSNQLYLTYRVYTNRILQAPFGFYSSILAGAGLADLAGDYDAFLFDNNVKRGGYLLTNVTPEGPEVSYRFYHVPFFRLDYGFGHQWFLVNRVCIDLGFYVEGTYFLADNQQDGIEISGLVRNFNANASILVYNGGGIGFSGYIKASYLIYR